MRIAICDDEKECIDRLLALIHRYFYEKAVTPELFMFDDPVLFSESALSSYDIVFLDANMGEISGIGAAQALRKVNANAVLVYISAFVEYAPMGYGVDAFRYLMKDGLENIFIQSMDEIMFEYRQKREKIILLTVRGNMAVSISDLIFIESFRHQIIFHLSNDTKLESKQHTLAELSEALASHHFLRIHKSYLVNPTHILTIKNMIATLDSGITLNCGKQSYTENLRAFMLWKGGI